jgi:hypothetical protein
MITDNEEYTYWVCPSIGKMHSDGTFHFYPALIIENKPDYYMTDWDWGTDFAMAQEACDSINERHGRSKERSMDIVTSSMRASNERNTLDTLNKIKFPED